MPSTPLPSANMLSFVDDARQMGLLFKFGAVSVSEVIVWADAAIIQMESPPYALLELSIAREPAEILTCLNQLSIGANFWMCFRRIIPQLRKDLAAHPERAESIANHMYLTTFDFTRSEVPADLSFIYRYDDAFSLARQGIYGQTETVYQEFMAELGGVALPPS